MVGKVRRLFFLIQTTVHGQTIVVIHNTNVHDDRFEDDPAHVVAHSWINGGSCASQILSLLS